MPRTSKNIKRFSLFVIATVIFGTGLLVGAAMNGSMYASEGKIDSKLLRQVKRELDNKFIFWKASSTAPTDEDFEYAVIQGYVSAYKDPYTIFMPPVEAKSFTENVQGSFGGVGMSVGMKDGNIVVIAPLKDSPAMKAGIKAGDIIIDVDGTNVIGRNSDEAVNMIRGPIDTNVVVKVVRKGEQQPRTFTITRKEIKIPTLDTEVKNGVFLIRLYNFSAESAVLFEKAVEASKQSGQKYVLIDLRGNPGGYLEAAVQISSFFLPEGSVVVSEKQGVEQTVVNHRSAGFPGIGANRKIGVLIDEGSASASEILAGALQDTKIATVFGTKSFGKGSVQELINFEGGSALKVTIAKWFTPSGTSISEHGITPDVEVLQATTTPHMADGTPIDVQLNTTIEKLKRMK